MRIPDGYHGLRPQFEAMRAALAVRDEGTVPCNNDLLAANFIDDGQQIWLIDYEYAGNNDACFELGNIAGECRLPADGLAELVTAYYGRPVRHKIARARLLGLAGMYGWTLWGAIQHAVSPIDFDFWAWAMERWEGAAAELTWPGFAGCWTRRPVMTDPDWTSWDHACRSSRPGPGRDHRRRRDRHQRRLPPDQARLDRRAAARAGPAVLRHHLARGRPGRPAAGHRERHPAGAVLHRAVRAARGRDRARHRVPPVRRRDRGPHRGPDDPAAPHRGHRRGVRPGLRAAHARRRPASATR